MLITLNRFLGDVFKTKSTQNIRPAVSNPSRTLTISGIGITFSAADRNSDVIFIWTVRTTFVYFAFKKYIVQFTFQLYSYKASRLFKLLWILSFIFKWCLYLLYLTFFFLGYPPHSPDMIPCDFLLFQSFSCSIGGRHLWERAHKSKVLLKNS